MQRFYDFHKRKISVWVKKYKKVNKKEFKNFLSWRNIYKGENSVGEDCS